MEDWYEKFKQHMNVIFTKKDFLNYLDMVKHDLWIYEKYLKKDAKLLDCGCGLGCTAIPMSYLGYNVTGIDIDKKVITAAKKNAKKFGKKIKIMNVDLYDIDKKFKLNSFDCIMHGGVLEHFPKRKIPTLIRKMLKVSHLIIASFPIMSKRSAKHYHIKKQGDRTICCDGLYRNLWTPKEWKEILKDFNIIETKKIKCHPSIGNFDEMFVVIKK
ncbi:class I SAM-dependent methyltransferase [Candidatus Woesearchaeota archaeon]|jgi:2-polyprenyl-3-methyl-5-hydroxy-6-metoxy-1,4-benzoquinol methylase|nr:class I SAM-dependent methyltransferase [Candidatus Woesearchaeota archaeon]MBT5272769.1 class I SAM-dependent methyltransferase [Candidatus Woesearchaeota archaeon]MBT6040381.1 class I SAM-dependent methyltransferase [Candidatus Woesearchaeota archaeon]MBT6336986.1 class I SAM-dependent methyltransferase [Candidatus Woesearchaeota archaeon]MBT7926872.1 class I SAM-dependent methyltransferase [Candidatus Woesearchaeota archaeon]